MHSYSVSSVIHLLVSYLFFMLRIIFVSYSVSSVQFSYSFTCIFNDLYFFIWFYGCYDSIFIFLLLPVFVLLLSVAIARVEWFPL